MVNTTTDAKQSKNNKFLILYKLFPPKLRTRFKYEFSKIFGFSPTYLYIKIVQNRFEDQERALVAYHLGFSQNFLFPDQSEIFSLSETYKQKYKPFYSYFFSQNHYPYDPEFFKKLLTSEKTENFTQNL